MYVLGILSVHMLCKLVYLWNMFSFLYFFGKQYKAAERLLQLLPKVVILVVVVVVVVVISDAPDGSKRLQMAS